jgi:hypothetical protein
LSWITGDVFGVEADDQTIILEDDAYSDEVESGDEEFNATSKYLAFSV